MTDTLARPRTDNAALAWIALAAVGLGWGAAQLLSKIATSTGHPALGLTFWEVAIGAACFTAALVATGGRLPLSRRHLVFYLVCGLAGTALPNGLSYTSIRHLPVGVQSMVLSTVPMTTLALALAIGSERFEPRRLAGIGLGLVAMLMIALPEASLPDPGQAPWLILPVIVSLSYAVENVYIDRARPRGASSLQVMCGLSWGGLLLITPLMLASGSWIPPVPVGVPEAALAGTALLHVLAYSGFVWLIGHAGPVFAAQVGYVVTASAVAWGMAVLGERHSAWVWGALAILFAGLALVRPRRGRG
jgi:drug/metabolite transporter (DMT)-like permease